jgi:hypothetical protein
MCIVCMLTIHETLRDVGRPAPSRRYPRRVHHLTPATQRPRDVDAIQADSEGSVPPGRLAVVALVSWAGLVTIAIVWGAILAATGVRLGIAAEPLAGHYEWRLGTRAFPALAVAACGVAFASTIAATARWRVLLLLTTLGAVVWAVALAVVDGWNALTDPLLSRDQYLATVPRVGDLGGFLAHFTDRIATYNVHTQGHPPGMVVALWGIDQLGLRSVAWNAVLVFAGGAAAIPATLIALREVAGEHAARTAAPFLVLAPAMIWWSSGDALFTGVSAWAVTLVVLATGRTGRRSDVLAVSGGVLFGITAFLSYGLVLLAVIPAVVALARHRVRPLVLAMLGALPIFVMFFAAGFWWLAGFTATRRRYWAGIASDRPYGYFLIGNLAAFGLAVGPATAAALAWLRDRRVWLLAGSALAVVAAADVSGLSKAEVERIWLPFVPWILVATAAFATTRHRALDARRWLALQAATGCVLAVAVRSPW